MSACCEDCHDCYRYPDRVSTAIADHPTTARVLCEAPILTCGSRLFFVRVCIECPAYPSSSIHRYTHIWPFEHARVRLHDGRHQGSHPGRRDKGRALERGRSIRDRAGEKGKEREEQELEQDRHRRSRSSPAFGNSEGQEVPEAVGASSRYLFWSAAQSSVTESTMGCEAGPTPSVPQVKIEYDVTEQGSRISGSSTPATALPLATPPFYTPMDISPGPGPTRAWPSPGARSGGTQFTLPVSSLPLLGPLPSFPLRLPNCPGGLLPSIGEQTCKSESSSAAPFGDFTNKVGAVGEADIDMGAKRDLRREPTPVDDYVNASYVQPLGTHKRYIATQGPLPSTYVDFWTCVFQPINGMAYTDRPLPLVSFGNKVFMSSSCSLARSKMPW